MYNYTYTAEGDTKFIQDRWLNRDYDYIALKHKGRWLMYQKVGYVGEEND